MKKTLVLFLALVMLVGVLSISVSSEEPVYGNSKGISTDCSCGGSYSEWTAFATEICQIRYKRKCNTCEAVQTAKDVTAKNVSYYCPAIGANVGDTVMLSLYSVYYTSSALMSAEDIVWSSEDVTITDGCIQAPQKGVYELVATAGSNVKTVYLVVKNATDIEYELFFDDFNGNALAEGYNPIELPNTSNYSVENGALIMDARGNKDNHMKVLLPSWLSEFGDYKITTDFRFIDTPDTTYWFATMARMKPAHYPFWQAAVRLNASASSGVEIARRNTASNVTSSAWTVATKGPHTENLSKEIEDDPTTKEYHTQVFELNGKTFTHTLDGVTTLTYTSTNASDYCVGDIGFHTRASKVAIDKVSVTLTLDDGIHTFTEWETITEASCINDGLESRHCLFCDEYEERTVEGGHKYVNYSAKLPTCTENGWKSYKTCSVCADTTYGGEILAFGHAFNREFHSIAHRGYSALAPENTLPAYIKAKEMGFTYVECDVVYTSDGVAVLNHDNKIDNVSSGTGKVTEKTYAQLLEYDFGSWKSDEYAGTKIATFTEFIELCAELGLHPYIELKDSVGITQERVTALVSVVEENGLLDNCTWISFSHTLLGYVKKADETARLGFLNSNFNNAVVHTANNLKTSKNEVFLDISYSAIINSANYNAVMFAIESGLAIEAWTVDDVATMNKLPKYVSGIASNVLYAEPYFYTTEVTAPKCAEQGYTTYTCACGATKVDDYVEPTGEHTAENGVCSVCGEDVYCADATHNLQTVTVSYPNGFDKAGTRTVKCLDCDAKETETVSPAIFTCKGYSVPNDDKVGVAVGFEVNLVALKDFERVTGKSIRYGAFAVAQSKIGDDTIFDENGNALSGVVFADVTEWEFATFDVTIVGFADEQKDLPFAMGAYVAVIDGETTEYSYIQRNEPSEGANYVFVTYNAIVDSKKEEEEVQ